MHGSTDFRATCVILYVRTAASPDGEPVDSEYLTCGYLDSREPMRNCLPEATVTMNAMRRPSGIVSEVLNSSVAFS